MKESSKDLSIIVPVYNEVENIHETISDLSKFVIENQFMLIIINDGSTDGSRALLEKFDNSSNINVINHKVNSGYGAAIKTGITHANTEYIITIDADGQHYLDDIYSLYSKIKKHDADMVIGKRQGHNHSTFYRSLGKGIIRFVANLLMPLNISDLNSGMKIYRTDLGKKYIAACPNSMAYSDIITLMFISQKHLVLEQPIKIKKRMKGKSTINIKTAFQTFYEIINIIMFFNPLKIFFPVSIVFFSLGLIWGLPIAIAGRGISVGAGLLLTMSVLSILLGLIAEQLASIRKENLNR